MGGMSLNNDSKAVPPQIGAPMGQPLQGNLPPQSGFPNKPAAPNAAAPNMAPMNNRPIPPNNNLQQQGINPQLPPMSNQNGAQHNQMPPMNGPSQSLNGSTNQFAPPVQSAAPANPHFPPMQQQNRPPANFGAPPLPGQTQNQNIAATNGQDNQLKQAPLMPPNPIASSQPPQMKKYPAQPQMPPYPQVKKKTLFCSKNK